jgi:hypothetical protein
MKTELEAHKNKIKEKFFRSSRKRENFIGNNKLN